MSVTLLRKCDDFLRRFDFAQHPVLVVAYKVYFKIPERILKKITCFSA